MTERRTRSLWERFLGLLDAVLPMSPEDRDERDDDGLDHSAARRLRLRIHLLGKRGKGGCR